MKKLKLGAKITALFVIIIVLAIGILGGITVYTEQTIIEKDLAESTEQTATLLAQRIDDFINTRVAVVEGLAELDYVKSMSLDETKSTLVSMNTNYSEFAIMFLTDTTGMQLLKSDDSDLSDLSEREYWQECMSTDSTVISDVLISNTTGEPAVVIAVPVHDSEGNIVGVIGATLDLSSIETMRAEVSIGESGYAFITDTSGVTIAHADSTKVNEDASSVTIVASALSGDSGSAIYTSGGEKKFGSYTTVESTGWAVVTSEPYSEAYAQVTTTLIQTLIIGLIIVAVAIVASILFSRWITAPIKILAKNAEDLANGKLDQEIKLKVSDEIGQLGLMFEKMRQSLRTLVINISDSADDVKGSSDNVSDYSHKVQEVSDQITVAIQELARGADDQAQSIQLTAKSINTIAESIEGISDNSKHSFESSKKASGLVQNGSRLVDDQNKKMSETTQAVNQVSDIIHSLNEKTAEIGEIIDVIDGVTEQTNLLALNAAIEAARAGESGKGFAVVADEVRILAEQSQQSTNRIQDIIKTVQDTTKQAVEQAALAGDAIMKQNKSVEETSAIFKEIRDMVDTIAEQIESISNSTNEVRSESSNILNNIENVSAVSEESAASTEEISASTDEQMDSIHKVVEEIEELNKLAEKLQESTKAFQLD